MSSSNMTMPFIILNMGAEMVYILNQRLIAQNVQQPKAHKVLIDVVRALFSEVFVEELFRPQEMYTVNSTRQVFDKLAHSSIMRLNKSSMDKLFDLIFMGFKYQILGCSSPVQYLHLTFLHLESVKHLCVSPEVDFLLNNCVSKLMESYAPFSNAQWLDVKIELFNFLQGKKVKVSLFLQREMQNPNGDLIIPRSPSLPFGTAIPGKVTYYVGSSAPQIDMLPLPFPDNPTDYCVSSTILDTSSKLGKNLYLGDESDDGGELSTAHSVRMCLLALENRAPYASFRVEDGSTNSTAYNAVVASGSSPDRRAASAKAEISLLSDLIGTRSSKDDDSKPLKLNLFPTSTFGGGSSKCFGGDFDDEDDDDGYNGSSVIMIDIDGTSGAKTVQRYMEDLNLGDSKAEAKDAKSEGDDEDDDLLALMDSAK
jgi:hypothetical protein